MSTETPARRATNLEELGRLQGLLFKPEEIGASIAAWRPRPDDVVITPFGKSGTTWLQQAFHTLRTGGDMDFEDISAVVPWIETAGALGQDLEAPQRAHPRGFKSHLPYDMLPPGARAVVAFRDPRDAMISMYRFFEGWFFEPETISFADFVRFRLSGAGPDYWGHLVSWWAQRDNPDVLLLTYEGMTADPEGTMRRLAAFCGIPLDDALLALALEQSSRAFMLAHNDRFDDAMMRRLSEVRCGLPPGGQSSKVRPKASGPARQEMTPDIEAALAGRWAERVAPATGLADYQALEAALRGRA